MVPDNEEIPPAIRACVAIVLGALGFLTGMFAVWVFDELPGVAFPKDTALWAGSATGLACLVAGYAYGNKTLEALGEVWTVLWQISVGVIATIRALIR